MMEDQNEKYKVWWDEKEGIIRCKYLGDFIEEDAKKYFSAVVKIAENEPGKALILNDMTTSGTASSGARKQFAELMKSDRFAKHAFWGANITTRVALSFVVAFSKVKNVKIFDTEEKALWWLKEG